MTQTWGIITYPGSGLELPVPPGWQAVRDAGAPLVVAAPREPGQSQRFRPNAVVTVEHPPAAVTDVAAYTAASVAGLAQLLTGLHVIAVDVITLGGHDGRRVLCGHRDGVYAIATEYWWTIVAGAATTLTASCQVEDYLDLSPVFENIAAGMVPARQLPGASAEAAAGGGAQARAGAGR